jgi:hypothetical protein
MRHYTLVQDEMPFIGNGRQSTVIQTWDIGTPYTPEAFAKWQKENAQWTHPVQGPLQPGETIVNIG